jgi:hypothetical protein
LYGPYNPDATKLSITWDFMLFCLLAAQHEVVPADWPWTDFLKVAVKFCVFAFEKSDAQERWGSESAFAALMGGRSLRATAELVYGSSCQQIGRTEEVRKLSQELDKYRSLDAMPAELLNKIGGRDVWKTFMQNLKK